MAKVTADTLASTIQDILDEYGKEIDKSLPEITHKVAQAGAKALNSESSQFKKTGRYARGWTTKAEEGRVGYGETIYNKNHPQVAHLLEFGHAKRNGGRTQGIPHIKPIEEQIIREFETEIIRTIK